MLSRKTTAFGLYFGFGVRLSHQTSATIPSITAIPIAIPQA
jgi:hypothetical protein